MDRWDLTMPEFTLPQPARVLSFPTRAAAVAFLTAAGFVSRDDGWHAGGFVLSDPRPARWRGSRVVMAPYENEHVAA